MWLEKTPKINDTVKIEWSEWYAKQIGKKSTIGIVLNFLGDFIKIDIGNQIIFLPLDSTFFVYEK